MENFERLIDAIFEEKKRVKVKLQELSDIKEYLKVTNQLEDFEGFKESKYQP